MKYLFRVHWTTARGVDVTTDVSVNAAKQSAAWAKAARAATLDLAEGARVRAIELAEGSPAC